MIDTQIKGCIWFVHGFWSLFRIDLENNKKISFARKVGSEDRESFRFDRLDITCMSPASGFSFSLSENVKIIFLLASPKQTNRQTERTLAGTP